MFGSRYILFTVGVALLAGPDLARAQQELPLAPVPPRGLHVSPWFEGWYANPDGTFTLSFGFYNRNTTESIEIPVGPDNYIEPAEFDGFQPTTFTTGRERGVFAITVPADFRNRDVVWTLTNRGGTYSVPGRVTSPAYELAVEPMAEGSVPPAVVFEEGGSIGRGPRGVTSDKILATRAGTPLPLTLYVDDSASQRPVVPLTTTWFKHDGPGEVTFEPRVQRGISNGIATATATFGEPGEYVLRGRVDNHAQRDSAPGEQCCWTNAYVRVVVAP